MADQDQEYLIEMDGNQAASVLFKVTLVFTFDFIAFVCSSTALQCLQG